MTVRDENGNWTRDRKRVRYAVYEYQNGAIRRDTPHIYEGTKCLDLLDQAMAENGEPGEDRRAYVRRKLRRLRPLGIEATTPDGQTDARLAHLYFERLVSCGMATRAARDTQRVETRTHEQIVETCRKARRVKGDARGSGKWTASLRLRRANREASEALARE